MKERPILFSAPMVRAILAGTKTQTRRVLPADAWPDPKLGVIRMCSVAPGVTGFQEVACRYGQPGDRLWVRETMLASPYRCLLAYAADGADCVADADSEEYQDLWGRRVRVGENGAEEGRVPSIHMPRWASRITLEVTGVRVERLQDISAADAWAEGIPGAPPLGVHIERMDEWVRWSDGVMRDDPRSAYRALWEHINGPGSWDANPWVWVLSFHRVDAAGFAPMTQAQAAAEDRGPTTESTNA